MTNIKIIDSKTNNKIGIGKIVNVDDKTCHLFVIPQKDGKTYYHLSFKLELNQPYSTMVKMKTFAINDLEKARDSAVAEYEKLIQTKLNLTKIEYTIQSNNKRPYSKNELKEYLNEYLQIPNQITLLKETGEMSSDKYLRLLNKKTKLEQKLIEHNILNKEGTFNDSYN